MTLGLSQSIAKPADSESTGNWVAFDTSSRFKQKKRIKKAVDTVEQEQEKE